MLTVLRDSPHHTKCRKHKHYLLFVYPIQRLRIKARYNIARNRQISTLLASQCATLHAKLFEVNGLFDVRLRQWVHNRIACPLSTSIARTWRNFQPSANQLPFACFQTANQMHRSSGTKRQLNNVYACDSPCRKVSGLNFVNIVSGKSLFPY